MRKNIKTASLLGAVTQLDQFITNHSATLTEKGLNPEALKAKVNTCCTTVQTAEQAQADAKSGLRACLENGWNGLPARFRRQPAAESRARLVA